MSYAEAKQKLEEGYSIKRPSWGARSLSKSLGDDPKYQYFMIARDDSQHTWTEEDYTATDWVADNGTEILS